MKKTILTILLFISVSGLIFSQSERVMSMGSLRYILPDRDFTLNPFDMGGNPAWLTVDERNSWLKIIPSFSKNDGNYKRKYDATTQDLYSLEFIGIKNLDEDGTFLGETSYLYNYRNSVPRSLRFNSYSGDAFFFTDTTTGNFRYNGPQINFMYSFEPVKGLFTGASVRYRILDGLKNVYSRAESLIREVEGNVGAAYSLTDNLVVGLNYIYSDNQEKIEAKSEDLLDVEVLHFRGDTYSIRERGQAEEVKSTDRGHNLNAQVYYRDGISEIGLTGSIKRAAQKILMPFNVGDQSFKEFEEGYTSFNSSSVDLLSRFLVSDNLFVGAGAGYSRDYVWSKNSAKTLTLWEWEIDEFSGSAGIGWILNPGFNFGAEYTFINQKADSSKYIDHKFINETSGNHNIRLGAEYEFLRDVFVRAGYNFSMIEKDFIYGGKDISINRITGGFLIFLTGSVELNIHAGYGFYGGLTGTLKRNDFTAYSSIKLHSF